MHIAEKIAYILVIIGGLNWGLYGAFEYDLVDMILESGSMFASIVYVLIGLSALFLILNRNKKCSCSKDVCSCSVEVNSEIK